MNLFEKRVVSIETALKRKHPGKPIATLADFLWAVGQDGEDCDEHIFVARMSRFDTSQGVVAAIAGIGEIKNPR